MPRLRTQQIVLLLHIITTVCASECNQLGKRNCNKRWKKNEFGRIKKCRWASDKFKVFQSREDKPWVYGACLNPDENTEDMCEWKIAK